jgi:hypothetical protein
MALATADQVKLALGLAPGDTSKDTAIAQALPLAESAIQDYTNRSFALNNLANPATEREFVGEDTGFTTIDDAMHGSVTGVTRVGAGGVTTPLTVDTMFLVQPTAGEFPVAWYIESYPSLGQSPEMGFAQNMDVLYREGRLTPRDQWYLRVTAKWGWPSIPGSVTQAAIWTTIAFVENPRPYISEAIQGYSRTREAATDAIPARARDLLGRYVKG